MRPLRGAIADVGQDLGIGVIDDALDDGERLLVDTRSGEVFGFSHEEAEEIGLAGSFLSARAIAGQIGRAWRAGTGTRLPTCGGRLRRWG